MFGIDDGMSDRTGTAWADLPRAHQCEESKGRRPEPFEGLAKVDRLFGQQDVVRFQVCTLR